MQTSNSFVMLQDAKNNCKTFNIFLNNQINFYKKTVSKKLKLARIVTSPTFTVWINCASDLKHSREKNRSLEQFFHRGQNNFGNKIPVYFFISFSYFFSQNRWRNLSTQTSTVKSRYQEIKKNILKEFHRTYWIKTALENRVFPLNWVWQAFESIFSENSKALA